MFIWRLLVGHLGGCGYAFALVHCGGKAQLGLRSLRGPWEAWLPTPRVAVPTLDTRFMHEFVLVLHQLCLAVMSFFFGAFPWGPWGVVAVRLP